MEKKKKLYVKTFGCQMNFYDTERICDHLAPFGYEMTQEADSADFIILNTCHIREKATEKLFSDLGRLRQIKQAKRDQGDYLMIGVMGCVAQAEGDVILKRAPYVDIVMGPQTYHRIPEVIGKANRRVAKLLENDKKAAGKGFVDVDFPLEPKFDLLPKDRLGQGASRFLSIQEGCDKFCSFCVVPYTRGAEYSRYLDDLYQEAKKLVALGAREITLLGQNVNAFHGLQNKDSQDAEKRLADLIYQLAEIHDLERIRYTTSHPIDMTDDLIQAHADCDKLMPFLHLPVQTGSNRLLRDMNRKHNREQYLEVIHKLREARPDMTLSSDFIVGYPGESDQDFADTLSLVEDVYYAQAFSFKYSPRPGTPAAMREDQVPESVKSERLTALQALLKQQQENFNKGFIGKPMEVLIEKREESSGNLIGRTEYMQLFRMPNVENVRIGDLVMAQADEAFLNSLLGKILTNSTDNILKECG